MFRNIDKSKIFIWCFLFAFLVNGLGFPPLARAGELNLPAPGTMLGPSPAFAPAILKGMTLHPENPLRFDFIVDTGNTHLAGDAFKEEATRLIQYFLASITIPEDDMWVNLSPYEKGRIIPDDLGITGLGMDLLAQDYMLKQLTASLIYPERDLGRKFWEEVYAKVKEKYGTTEVPVNTFNKVWIVPDKAVVYEHNDSVFVVQRHLKVMLEQDYLALEKNIISPPLVGGVRGGGNTDINTLGSQIVREVLLPEIEKEVNEGKNFAQLRQIYNSMILAVWYKKNLRDTLLGQVYADKGKTKGVDVDDKEAKMKIYKQYLEAFKKGVYNYIKEDYDPAAQATVARKYFSGGAVGLKAKDLETRGGSFAELPKPFQDEAMLSKGRVRLVICDLVENLPAKTRSLTSAALILSTLAGGTVNLGAQAQTPPRQTNAAPPRAAAQHDREYWMNLARENYVDVFKRAGEFLKEHFAFDILKAAVLADYIPSLYQSPSSAAMEYLDRYIDHPRAKEIAELALDLDSSHIYHYMGPDLSRMPYGQRIIELLAILNPSAVLHILSIERPRWNRPDFLDNSKSPAVKAILEINKTPYPKYNEGQKLRMTELLQDIVHNRISLEQAAIVDSHLMDFFKSLVRIKAEPDYLGPLSVKQGLFMTAQDIQGRLAKELGNHERGDTVKAVENFSIDELYALMSYTEPSLYYHGQKSSVIFLYDLLSKKMREENVSAVKLCEKEGYGEQFRRFVRTLVAFDRLGDFLNGTDHASKDLMLREFIDGRKYDEWYRFANSAVVLTLANILAAEGHGDIAYYSGLIHTAETEIDAFTTTADLRYILKEADRYVEQPDIQAKIKNGLRIYAQKRPSSIFYSLHSGGDFDNLSLMDLPYGREILALAIQNDPEEGFTWVLSNNVGKWESMNDFLDLFDRVTIRSFLEASMKAGEKNSDFPMHNRSIQLILAEHLMQSSGSESEKNYYGGLVDDAKQAINNMPDGPDVYSQAKNFQAHPFIGARIHAAVDRLAETGPSDGFFYGSKDFIETEYGLKAFVRAAYQNPAGALHGIRFSSKIRKVLQKSDDPVILKLFAIDALGLSSQRKEDISLLMDGLVKGDLTMTQAVALSANLVRLRKHLAQLAQHEDVIGKFIISERLPELSLRSARSVRDPYDLPGRVELGSVAASTPWDLYNMIITGRDEEFIPGFFNRLQKMLGRGDGKISGHRMLEEVDYNQFRIFMMWAAEYGQLNAFLATVDMNQRDEVLVKFVKGLEDEDDFMEQSMAVAAVINATQDKELLTKLQTFVKQEFLRVQSENHSEGMAIYGLLSGMLGQRPVIDQNWFKDTARKFPLPKVDRVSVSSLLNAQKTNVQQYFFYDDNDGKVSFRNFFDRHKDPLRWKIEFDKDPAKNYVHVISLGGGNRIEIFANKPTAEGEKQGVEEISAVMAQRNIHRHIVVQKGRGNNIRRTINQIQSTDAIVFFSGDVEFPDIVDVLGHDPEAFIFSTHGAGSPDVDALLLNMLDGYLLRGENIVSEKFWTEATDRANSYHILEYTPPHRHFTAEFAAAYNKIMDQLKKPSYQAPEAPNLGLLESPGKSLATVRENENSPSWRWAGSSPRQVIDGILAESKGSAQPGTRGPGGIDLNAKKFDLQIVRDGKGVPLPVVQQPLADMRIEGFFPVIVDVKPADISLVLGLTPQSAGQ